MTRDEKIDVILKRMEGNSSFYIFDFCASKWGGQGKDLREYHLISDILKEQKIIEYHHTNNLMPYLTPFGIQLLEKYGSWTGYRNAQEVAERKKTEREDQEYEHLKASLELAKAQLKLVKPSLWIAIAGLALAIISLAWQVVAIYK